VSLPIIPLLLTCGPLGVALFAGWRFWREKQSGPLSGFTIWAVCIVIANAAYAAFTFLRYSLWPSNPPPWKGPGTLHFGLLFLTAPFGIVVCVLAALHHIFRDRLRGRGSGATLWSIGMLLMASLILSFVVLMEGITS
jgi:hypothetical protein